MQSRIRLRYFVIDMDAVNDQSRINLNYDPNDLDLEAPFDADVHAVEVFAITGDILGLC